MVMDTCPGLGQFGKFQISEREWKWLGLGKKGPWEASVLIFPSFSSSNIVFSVFLCKWTYSPRTEHSSFKRPTQMVSSSNYLVVRLTGPAWGSCLSRASQVLMAYAGHVVYLTAMACQYVNGMCNRTWGVGRKLSENRD